MFRKFVLKLTAHRFILALLLGEVIGVLLASIAFATVLIQVINKVKK